MIRFCIILHSKPKERNDMKIAVYCSSRDNIDETYKADAALVGKRIGMAGAHLVYGGVGLGLMRIVASEARKAGGRVVGVVPISRKALANKDNTDTILARDLNDRKSRMMLLGDAFVVLPGGYGTLDELISTFSFLTFTGDTSKRIVVINRDGIFDPILAQLRLMASRGLLDEKAIGCLSVVSDGEECCRVLGI